MIEPYIKRLMEKNEMKETNQSPRSFAAVKKYKDGEEAVIEYFPTLTSCLQWIQQQPKSKEWDWHVGEFE